MSIILNDYHFVQFPSSETSNYEKDSVAQVKQICQSVFEFVGKSVFLRYWAFILPFVIFGHKSGFSSKKVDDIDYGVA